MVIFLEFFKFHYENLELVKILSYDSPKLSHAKHVFSILDLIAHSICIIMIYNSNELLAYKGCQLVSLITNLFGINIINSRRMKEIKSLINLKFYGCFSSKLVMIKLLTKQ